MTQMYEISFLLAFACCVVGCGHCDREEKVLATDVTGRSVVSEFEACTSVGTTLAATIDLRSASGHLTTILKYEPSGGIAGCKGKMFPRARNLDPKVNWSDQGVIHITIGVVSSIYQKLDDVDGVRVTYDIGTVTSEVCQH